MDKNKQKLGTKRVASNQLTAEQKAGMQLAKSLLWMIAGAIVLYALICLEHGCNQSRAPALPGARILQGPGLRMALHACTPQTDQSQPLDFAFRNFQYVLNVLLPVFTTVLGYIFGTRSRG
ncbi:hypothetical protein [Chitinophaga caseinilytica]|uniref:Uncharacterized protein n=1 Tax=Chitinophaga caseinilytica TaxID=2267521 RepID=A0ABZ2YWY3_9BACT